MMTQEGWIDLIASTTFERKTPMSVGMKLPSAVSVSQGFIVVKMRKSTGVSGAPSTPSRFLNASTKSCP